MRILNKWPYLVGIVFGIFVFTMAKSYLGDNDIVKQKYDGIVVTDKSNSAYMLVYNGNGSFNIREFDIEKMRLKSK